MTTHNPVQQLREIFEGPVMRPVLEHWRRKHFVSKEGLASCYGLFESFAEARASLPPSLAFDQAALAAEYVEVRTKRIFAYDYPVLWWLERAIRHGAARVLDIGGSVGVHYYAYRRYFEMPPELTWRIVEVPAIASIGREMALRTDAQALSFVEDLESALSGADIWISAGAIQYFEDGRPSDLLKRCATRPKHILLNKLPLYAGQDFITTQNLGEGSFSPFHVYNRAAFIGDMTALGYTLGDEWAVHERSLYLPGHPDRSFPTFTGLYFTNDIWRPAQSSRRACRTSAGSSRS